MKQKVWIGAALAFGLVSPAAAHPEDPRINAVYQKLAEARAANDVEGMASAFASGGILVDQRPGPALAGGDLAARLRPMAARIAADGVRIDTSYRVEKRSVMGDIALDAGFMKQSMAAKDGRTSTRYARFLVTLQKGADQNWRIIGDASMPADEAAWNGLARADGLQFGG